MRALTVNDIGKDWLHVYELYQSGCSITKIALKMNCSRGTVYKRFRILDKKHKEKENV